MNMESLLDNISCSICLEVFDDPQSLKCRHSFCAGCLSQMPAKSVRNRSSRAHTSVLPAPDSRANSNQRPQSSYRSLLRRFIRRSRQTSTSMFEVVRNVGNVEQRDDAEQEQALSCRRSDVVISCPLCRQASSLHDILPDFNVANIIKALRLGQNDRYANSGGRECGEEIEGEVRESGYFNEVVPRPRTPTAPPQMLDSADEDDDEEEAEEEEEETWSDTKPPSFLTNLNLMSHPEPTAPPLEHPDCTDPNANSAGSQQLPHLSLHPHRSAKKVNVDDVVQLSLVKDRPVLVQQNSVLMSKRDGGFMHWYGDPRPKGFYEARDIVRVGHEYVLCCSDYDSGLMHFSEKGKFRYYVAQGNFTAVASHGNTLIALDKKHEKVVEFCYRSDLYDRGVFPWQQRRSVDVSELCHNNHNLNLDLVLIGTNIYISDSDNGKIWLYRLGTGFMTTYCVQNKNTYTSCPRMMCFRERYLLLAINNETMHILDTKTWHSTSLSLRSERIGDARKNIVSFCCSHDRLFVLSATGKAHELAEYTIKEH